MLKLSDQNSYRYPIILEKDITQIKLRFSLFYILNQKLDTVIDLFDLLNTATNSVGHKLCLISHCIFHKIKERILTKFITLTKIPRPEDDTSKVKRDNICRLF